MNLNEEIRDGYLVTSQIKKVWTVQMEIAKKIFEVCQKHNLKIVCCGGTAIGTVRHHGYIPWDDDLDLEMLREDYDKLCSVAKDEFKDPYIFQTALHEKEYCYGHAQVRKSGTTAILKNDTFRNYHLGIFVDIFVLDAIPNDENVLRKLRARTEKLQHDMFIKAFFRFGHSNPFKDFKSYVRYFCLIPKNLREMYKEYENCFRANSIDECTEVTAMAFTWSIFEKTRRTKHIMDDIKWLPFEDMSMPISSYNDEILTRQYGEYMKPVKAPSLHGGFLVLDAERDYTYYLNEVRKHARKEIFKKILRTLHLIS